MYLAYLHNVAPNWPVRMYTLFCDHTEEDICVLCSKVSWSDRKIIGVYSSTDLGMNLGIPAPLMRGTYEVRLLTMGKGHLE